VADDVDPAVEDLVAVRVIEMEMGVDDGRHRFVRDGPDLVEQHPGRGRGHMIVDRHHVVVVHDERRVAHDGQRASADGVIHAVPHFVEPECVPLVSDSCGSPPRLRGGGNA
jgi:hypothetical protein